MAPRKLNVLFCLFAYAGNGGYAAIHPSIAEWLVTTVLGMKKDPRIGDIHRLTLTDTPITMTRCAAVEHAKKVGADVIVFMDSDNIPDLYIDQPAHKPQPFFASSFDFLYAHYERGPVVVFAPYCGPPPQEVVYAFEWARWEDQDVNDELRLELIPREQAARMAGIYPVGAGATGLMMIDMRVFDLIKPPYFYYEWKNAFQAEKASTEDVTFTRDISIAGQVQLGYNPLFCNFDAWAGHIKPKIVGKPSLLSVSQVAEKMQGAVLRNQPAGEQQIYQHADPFRTELSHHAPKFHTEIPDNNGICRDVVNRLAESVGSNGHG